MKKLAMMLLIILALGLAGCGTGKSAGNSPATSNPSAVTLPPASQLIAGTLKLEGTQEAVTPKEAAQLLPLWQVYQSLGSSGTAAQEEIDALVQQIQETMTSSQVAAIKAMSLTEQDIASLIVDQRIVDFASQQNTSAETSTNGSQGGPDGGIPPAVMAGSDPPLGMSGQAAGGSSSASSASEVASNPGIVTALLDALIQMLRSKTA